MSQPTGKHLDVLKKWFGHSEFRAKQWEIIKAIIEEKRDVCTVMATGYGKSLCYQFPPVFCEGLGIVVSPLISLMQDQILSLKVCNIPACLFGSAQNQKQNARIGVLSGEYRLIYVTPEWCSSESGEELLTTIKKKKIDITLVAIDEAHCISQWGFDFRSNYRHLGKLRKLLQDVPFIALTATATPQVRDDICSSLKLIKPKIITTNFDRPNLFLSASPKGDSILKDIEQILSKENLRNDKTGSTIIYCPTKKISYEIADVLNGSGIKCALYHADLSLKIRKQVHEDFVKDVINIIVATVAFGMGIDKPDVRTVIHFGAPKDLESYYQEIGRAGRDGLPSYCHAFYSQADFTRNDFFFQNLSGAFLEHKRKLARVLECLLQTTDCRRKILLSHFDPNFVTEPLKSCCDNCSRGRRPFHDFDLTEDALLLLRAVKALGGSYGLSMSIFLLKKSGNKRLPTKFHKHELYGKGENKSEVWWKCLGNLLIRECLLEKKSLAGAGRGWSKNNFPVTTVCISEKGEQYLNKQGSSEIAVLKPTHEMMSKHKIKLQRNEFSKNWVGISTDEKTTPDNSNNHPGNEDKIKQDKLYKDLIMLRSKLAEKLQCMPYMIAGVATLQVLSIKRPETLEELANIEGITAAKVNNFGNDILSCIQKLTNNEKPCQNDTADLSFSVKDSLHDGSKPDTEKYCIVNAENLCSSVMKTDVSPDKSIVCENLQNNLFESDDLDDYFLNIDESTLINNSISYSKKTINAPTDVTIRNKTTQRAPKERKRVLIYDDLSDENEDMHQLDQSLSNKPVINISKTVNKSTSKGILQNIVAQNDFIKKRNKKKMKL